MSRHVCTLFLSVFALGFEAFANAQEAQIQGQVLDPSGAGITKALMRVVEQQSGTERKTQTSDNGQYVVPGLTPGAYKIFVEAPGFSTAMSDQITLNPGQSVVMNFTLKVGATSADIIVTAEKRDERLQDVPVPVSVLSSETLVATDQLLMTDYAPTVPGFTVEPLEFNNTNLAIRGITTGGFSSSATVGIMLDGVPITGHQIEPPNFDPGDLSRIEVLRGPQGTLYGASSMGGLVNYVTIDPDFTHYSGRFEAGTNYIYNGGKPGYNLRGSINVPLTDGFAVRVSAYEVDDPGYIDDPVLHLHSVNEMENYGGQLLALWQPLDRFSLKLGALFNHLKSYGSSEINIPTAVYPQTAGLGDLEQIYIPGVGQTTTAQADSAIAKAKVGNIDISSLTGFNNYLSDNAFDWSSSFSSTVQKQFGVSGALFYSHSRYTTFSEEVRASSSVGRFDWLVGGFYSHTSWCCYGNLYAENADTGQIAGLEWSLVYPSVWSEGAGFADLTYHFTDRFDVQIGGRESHDTGAIQDEGLTQSGPFIGPTPSVTPPLHVSSYPFTYLLTPRFRFSSDLMLYARFASGYRPGGGNPPQPGIPSEFGPDKTYNYEVGTKGEFLNHRLAMDTSLYYIDWRDIQVSAFGPNSLAFGTNGGRAKSEGVEISTTVRPAKGLTVSDWVSYDDAALTQNFPGCPASCPVYGVAGNRLPFSSRFSGHLDAEQRFPVSERVQGFVAALGNFVGDRVDIFNTAQQRQNLPGYTQIDLRSGAAFGSWTANLVANNVADKRGIVSGGVGNVIPFGFNIIKPRTVTFSITKTF